ncbi:kinase-like domain-containing protein, partial [Ochromonadaceae sp. CCMP2298]
YHLNSRGCFPPEEARFYSARLISALLCLHSLNIVHRDLKPENILMDTRGYTKLTDFGLADYVPSTGLTVPCGTRGYWAPEMISRPFKPYFYSVDWFSLGVCIYEFLTGENPFFYIAGDDDAAVDRTIISGEPDYSLIKDDSADLLRLLLCKDPAQRLGSGPEGAQAIQQHDWFAGIDWESLSTMIPPWFPESEINMKDQGEIGDFKDANESKKVLLTEEDQLMYAEWSYVSQPAFQKEVLEFLLYEEIRGPIRPVDNSECCILS